MLSSGDIVWNVIHWTVIITIKVCVNIPKCIGNCGSLGFYNMVSVVAKLVRANEGGSIGSASVLGGTIDCTDGRVGRAKANGASFAIAGARYNANWAKYSVSGIGYYGSGARR